MMNGAISLLMSRQVWTVDMDDTIAQVETLFAAKGLSWAPVTDAGRGVVGVISDYDLLKFHAQQQGDPTEVRAWQASSYRPISVPVTMPIAEVARLMVERRVHHVVVNDREGLAGVVSSLDFVRTFATAG